MVWPSMQRCQSAWEQTNTFTGMPRLLQCLITNFVPWETPSQKARTRSAFSMMVRFRFSGASVFFVFRKELRQPEAMGEGVFPCAGIHSPGSSGHNLCDPSRQILFQVFHFETSRTYYSHSHLFSSSRTPVPGHSPCCGSGSFLHRCLSCCRYTIYLFGPLYHMSAIR